MNDFKFTKSLLKETEAKTSSNLHSMTDIARLERIHDNMSGINPYTKKPMEEKKIEELEENKEITTQDNKLHDQLSTLRNIKTTND